MAGEEIIWKLIDKPKYILVISLISGFLIFGESSIINKLALASFVENFRLWIGIVFLVTTGFWLVDIVLLIVNKVKIRYSNFTNNRLRQDRLKKLTDEEKTILRKYIYNEVRTQKLDYVNGIVKELERYQIIYQSSNISHGWTIFSYNIQPWAWDYLNKHKELLK